MRTAIYNAHSADIRRPFIRLLSTWGGTKARVCGTGGRHFHMTRATASNSARGSCSRALSVTPLQVGGVICLGHTLLKKVNRFQPIDHQIRQMLHVFTCSTISTGRLMDFFFLGNKK